MFMLTVKKYTHLISKNIHNTNFGIQNFKFIG